MNNVSGQPGHAGLRPGMLTLEQLRVLIAEGAVDTVEVSITDMQGRLQGKRLSAEYFLDVVVPHETEACSYLLAVEIGRASCRERVSPYV